ncbi:MAG: hypothetical protein JO227_22585 [Acetobacteraceae bacterium]|nr:hypothetical protein [Acetobacteraceae bacterium]
MQELISRVAQAAGISEETAQQAITAVLEFIKERLPAPLAAQLDNLIAGQSEGEGESVIASAARTVFGMFSKKE